MLFWNPGFLGEDYFHMISVDILSGFGPSGDSVKNDLCFLSSIPYIHNVVTHFRNTNSSIALTVK